ncbi:sensor histidine kinase [Amycolatopsis saalfeldensis]|uniref:histidine kinase n=1 Tax=Amycolatopsis saalfeldensis TaxID=394193 RepID=A0A1H8X4M9_9PSEU|nr:nitrate- and nitrite sensing domain-containing protein [Amycolatopsis saalfeldensis]SEP34627.1 Histidine kinase-, DNA gyrase B-, and HSP90-like ATPase [Amycolatopsis saalfeldensis]
MPVGKLLGRPPRRSRWSTGWRAVLGWRDWSLAVKLSAVTLVPIVLAVVLGVTAIVGQVSRSDDYGRIDRLVGLSTQLRALTDGLQRERTLTAQQLIAGSAGVTPELKAARAATDAAVDPFTTAAGRVGGDESSVSGAVNSATAQVNEITVIRQQVGAGLLDAAEAVSDYNAVTTALIAADTAVAAGASADALGGTPNALHDLEAAKEQASVSQALIAFGISRGGLPPQQLSDVRDAELRFDDRMDDFNAAATAPQRQDLDSTLKPDSSYDRKRMVGQALGEQGATSEDALRGMSAQEWNSTSTDVVNQLGDVGKRLGAQATSASAALVEDASSSAGLLAVLLFAALVVAAAVVFLITRQLLRSLSTLRRSALDVAEKELPAAVRNIQEGRSQSIDVAPVPVHVHDEVGEVARAFEQVHSQALRLATEQAAMRAGYSSVFVNLSRRSQSLVQRQLQLIERLERDEEDADQLATLFQLDHLATRMRRNNENLMVLSGAEPGRRSGQPVSAHDVLRAAVSEIEQYQRVSVQQPPAVKIVGFAASDVQRLVAELLDNATAFSAPETQVTVATRLADDGSLNIDILDKGIGMNEYEVMEANSRLTEAGSVDLATSRRMGLFVVGRLAGRHRIGVSLHGGKDIVGVRATVLVPPELVMTGAVLDGAPHTGPMKSVAAPPVSPGGLPRRQRPVNGSARPGAVPLQQGHGDDQLRPSFGDLAGYANGQQVSPAVRPPSDLEISGTALFSPIPREDGPPPLPRVPQILQVPPPRPEPEPEPVAETPEPAEPSGSEGRRQGELPSGKDLFSANGTTLSDWWNQAAQQVPEVPPPSAAETTVETTPIFDEMLSVWFRSPAPAADPQEATASPAESSEASAEEAQDGVAPVTTPEQDERNWDFASDENWRTVQAVSQAEPTAFTPAGLPRRRRGEQLMPGSATSEPSAAESSAAKPELPVRDPSDVRGRLNSFQRGVTRGRQETRATTEPAAAAQPAPFEAGPSQGLGAQALGRLDGTTGTPAAGRLDQPDTAPGTDAPAQGYGAGGPVAPVAGHAPEAPSAPGQDVFQSYSDRMAAQAPATTDPQPTADRGPEAFTAGPEVRPAFDPEQTIRPDSSAPQAIRPDAAAPQIGPADAPAAQAGRADTVAPQTGSPATQAGRQATPAAQNGHADTAAPQTASLEGSAPQTVRPDAPAPHAGTGQETESGRPDALPSRRPGAEAPARPNAETASLPGAESLARPNAESASLPGAETLARPGAETLTRPGAETPTHPEEEAPSRPDSPPASLPARRPAASDVPPGPPADGPRDLPTTVPEILGTSSDTPGSEWNFGSDDEWRQVEAVSQSTPALFTSAGLPRRRRGEQLLPGSAPPPSGTAGPRPTRDAHDVRGRLSSFQQGIQRGRHRTAQAAAETNHETLEGE